MGQTAKCHTLHSAPTFSSQNRNLTLSKAPWTKEFRLTCSSSALDPFTHTAGHWLRHDQLQRAARFIRFDFGKLCKKVVELCPGASDIIKYKKKEGGFNRVFIFTCDNGKRIVARLPTQPAGPPRLITNSEVTTIKYREFSIPGNVVQPGLINILVQANTTIPIPLILDWNDGPSNSIGSEYIIMEHVEGIQLHQKWPTMSGKQRISCIRNIMINIGQVAALKFPAYGSLYQADVPFVESASKIPFIQGICIGPHCGTRYWDCTVGEARHYDSINPNRGPCRYSSSPSLPQWSPLRIGIGIDLPTYCDGLIDVGLSRLPPDGLPLPRRPDFYKSKETHDRLLSFGRDVLHRLSEDIRVQKAATPTLYHSDLHKRNIFVSEDDPTIVTGFIDWQSSSIEPAFEHTKEIPDFAALSPTDSEDDQSPEDDPTILNARLCRQAFDVGMQGYIPKLFAVRALDENLLRPFHYCHRTWRDGAVAFERELMETSSRWTELGLPNGCPYPLPTPDEISIHNKEFEDFQAVHRMRQAVMSHLDTPYDGWVANDRWEVTKTFHRETFEGMAQGIRHAKAAGDEDASEEFLRQTWPYDLDWLPELE